jgi:DNA-binding MarR family transcriptional regulator
MNYRIIDSIMELKSGCNSKIESIQEKLKLSPVEFRGILTMEPGMIVPCKILSKKMGLSISRGSRAVEKLLKNGYLKEIKNSGDKRVLNITLADKGTKVREKIYNSLEECEQKIMKKIKKSEKEHLLYSLHKITNILNDK